MSCCERMEKCKYFNERLKELEAVQEMWKKNYCRADKTQCARYMVLQALGLDKVPNNLVPTQIDRAKSLISDG